MADSDHAQMIAEFCKVTGIESSRAQLYLEANGWDSDLAMSSYFEETEENADMGGPPEVPLLGNPKPVLPSGGARIATFASLMNTDDNSEEEGQAFYAGGSERSGQQVIGPGKRKAGNEVVEEMFKAVRKHGGEVVDTAAKKCGSTKLKAFRGSGFVLGSTSDASDAVPGENMEDAPRETEVRLQLWRTGFTVDDGPMRDYQDTTNKEFLDCIRRGEVPQELMHKPGDPEIHLNVEDRSHDEYVPMKPVVKAFSGTGFRLGNITPTVGSETAPPSEKNDSEAQESLKLDESKYVTSIQIRLANGTRLVMKANHDHTVGDVRRFIVTARPEYSASVFTLMTAFPIKELSVDEATLAEENLLNSLIVQKLK